MVSINKGLKGSILPVAGESVLRKVISSDREEIHHRCKPVTDDSRSRGLYHYAKLNAVTESNTVSHKLRLDLIADRLNLFKLRYACYHREHYS